MLRNRTMCSGDPGGRHDGVGAPVHSRTISLGIFTYLNVQPVYYGMLHEGTRRDVRMVTGVPTRLNRALLSGEVDLSSVSGYAYAEHASELRLIPHLSINAPEAVESVLLFSRYPDWRQLDGRRVAITNHSASAVNLVRVLCKQRYHIEPQLVTMPPDLDAMFASCDAALVIGDMALIEGNLRREIAGVGRPAIFDLGQEWVEWTGLPFVFGVWAAHAASAGAIRRSGILEQVYHSKREGLAHIDDIGLEQAARLGLAPQVLAHYLRQMTYDLSEQDLAGWRLFLELSLPAFRWNDIRWL
ncbi:MAG: menaquinone biosynthesis protein [Ktedonobacteraceae bacterium]